MLWLVALATAAAGEAADPAEIELFVHGLRDNQVVFGTVEVEVEVFSDVPVVELVIHLDGDEVARFDEPPYRLVIDLGEDNLAHRFEMTATSEDGATATRAIVTGTIAVNEELDLELQQLYVTVTRGGERLLDLARDDFAIIDDQSGQRMVTFERGDVPLTAVLLIDSSLSMEGTALRAALAGARTFVAGMRQLDEAKVRVFSDRLLASTPFTSDPAAVSAVMDTVKATGGTAINDHLFSGLEAARPSAWPPGDRAALRRSRCRECAGDDRRGMESRAHAEPDLLDPPVRRRERRWLLLGGARWRGLPAGA